MVDANLAIVAVSAVALVGLFFAAIVWARSTRDSDVALESGRADRAEALAEHRRLRLVEAAQRAVAKATGAAADASHEASVALALASARDDVDAAVELLLGPDPGGPAPGPDGSPNPPVPHPPKSLDGGPPSVVSGPPSGPPRG